MPLYFQNSSATTLLFCILFLLGCNDSGADGNDPSFIEYLSGNEPPVIEQLSINPPNPTPKSSLDVTAVATDPDDDELTYTWSANGGEFRETTGNPVTWVPKGAVREYTIKCIVSDGQATTSGTITLTLESKL